MENLIRWSIICIINFYITALSSIVKSCFVSDVVFNNTFLISIAIFAIHASTSAILISQLNILNIQHEINVSATLVSIKNSFFENALLIFCVLVISILHSRTIVVEYPQELINYILSFFLLIILTSQLWIIYDILIGILAAFKFNGS